MKLIEVEQGTPEWHALRGQTFGASLAPAMMGDSKHMKRNELLSIRGGYTDEQFSKWVEERVLDRGHKAEAAARPIVAEAIGQSIDAAFGVSDEHPELSTSFDGITIFEDITWEHKLWNDALAAAIESGVIDDPHYYWQLEHNLLVSGADKCVFSCGTDDGEKIVKMDYYSVPERRQKLIAGWRQFFDDLAQYKPHEEPPLPEAEPIQQLPALAIDLVGEVRSSNFPTFRAGALEAIERFPTDLQTDQDFVNAKGVVKWCVDVEDAILEFKRQALGKTASIEELFQQADHLKETVRSKRLTLEKLVKYRETQIKSEIRGDAEQAWRDFIDSIEEGVNRRVRFTLQPRPDFAAAMKNKRTLSSLHNAVDTLLAQSKIEIIELQNKVAANLRLYDELAADHQFLFRDFQDLIWKDRDGLEAIVKQRIAEHQSAEEKRLQEERDRIRQEEQDKARREAEQAARQPQPEPIHNEAPTEAVSQEQPTARHTVTAGGRNAGKTARRRKPSDTEIIQLVAAHFGVQPAKAIEWIQAMDIRQSLAA